MPASERSASGTPWILLAIYVVLAGQLTANGGSPFGDMMVMVSLVPAVIGFALAIKRYNDTVE